ncbi:MAG: hypothetical protein GF410_02630 [Chitinivibrionales bacterium]|nr:hypothetical protein [Chitinivibrionales bacterium]
MKPDTVTVKFIMPLGKVVVVSVPIVFVDIRIFNDNALHIFFDEFFQSVKALLRQKTATDEFGNCAEASREDLVYDHLSKRLSRYGMFEALAKIYLKKHAAGDDTGAEEA